MTRRSRPVVVSLTVVSVVFAGCGVRTQDSPRLADPDAVPFRLLHRDVTTLVPPPAAPSEPVSLCFIDGDQLAVIARELDTPASTIDVLRALADPPTSEGGALRTAVGPPMIALGVRVNAGVAQVDLDPGVATLGGANQLLAIAQIVCTLTARPGIGQVAFTIAASPVDVPRGDGSLTTNPVSRDDYASLLS